MKAVFKNIYSYQRRQEQFCFRSDINLLAYLFAMNFTQKDDDFFENQ